MHTVGVMLLLAMTLAIIIGFSSCSNIINNQKQTDVGTVSELMTNDRILNVLLRTEVVTENPTDKSDQGKWLLLTRLKDEKITFAELIDLYIVEKDNQDIIKNVFLERIESHLNQAFNADGQSRKWDLKIEYSNSKEELCHKKGCFQTLENIAGNIDANSIEYPSLKRGNMIHVIIRVTAPNPVSMSTGSVI